MSVASTLSRRVPVPLLVLGVFASLIPQLALAQKTSAPDPYLAPLETKLLDPRVPLAERGIITATTISPTDIATPSLWWMKKQFDEDKDFGSKFIFNWIAYQDEKRVDLVVNRQVWTLLDYIGRYRFVNKLGTVARGYNYDVRVFNQQAELLATYTCTRTKTAPNYSEASPPCEMRRFAAFGRDSLQVPRAQ